MSEGSQELLLLIGELRGDMKEGQRQRSAQFKMLESLSHQMAEVSATFNAHAQHEDEWREAFLARVAELELKFPELEIRITAIEQREIAVDPRRGVHPAVITVGMGGTGLLGVLFGNGMLSGAYKAIEALKRFLH